jgi:hypothetical protein
MSLGLSVKSRLPLRIPYRDSSTSTRVISYEPITGVHSYSGISLPGSTQHPCPAAARATEFDDDVMVIDAAQTTSSPDRKAVLKGIQGMSSDERNLLMEELLTSEATSSSF